MRQAQVVHVADEVGLVGVAAEARVVAPLLGHAGDRDAAVVVRRVEQAVGGQRQELLVHRAEQALGAALLEVGAAAAADQQRVAGEGHRSSSSTKLRQPSVWPGRGAHLRWRPKATRSPCAAGGPHPRAGRQAGAATSDAAAAALLQQPGGR
jgi:hypothetical protein